MAQAFAQQRHVSGMGGAKQPQQPQVGRLVAGQGLEAPLGIQAWNSNECDWQAAAADCCRNCDGGPCHRACRQPAQHCAEKILGIDRLGDEVVHAGRLAALAIVVEGIGGHRQDRQGRSARQRADRAGRFEPI
ncbi:MAG: hypothetical protein NTX56_13515, partial [Proteobacteria bacterium]|nr:hypothetical protein [Pseudomonadota bacterium]